MKRQIFKTFLGMTGIFSLFLAGAEAETMFNQVLWSGSMMLICYASFKGIEALMTKEEKEEKA